MLHCSKCEQLSSSSASLCVPCLSISSSQSPRPQPCYLCVYNVFSFRFARASSSPAKYVMLHQGSPSGVSSRPLGSTCCSQINERVQQTFPKHAPYTGLLCIVKWDYRRSVQLLCALTAMHDASSTKYARLCGRMNRGNFSTGPSDKSSYNTSVHY